MSTTQSVCGECDRPAELTPVIVNHTREGHPVLSGWCANCRETHGITVAGSVAALLDQHTRIKARRSIDDSAWAELFAVESALRAFDACPGGTYNED